MEFSEAQAVSNLFWEKRATLSHLLIKQLNPTEDGQGAWSGNRPVSGVLEPAF